MNEQENPQPLLSKPHQNIFWLSVIAIAQTTQFLVWFVVGNAVVSCFIHGETLSWSQLEWNSLQQITYYRFFVVMVIGLQFFWVMRNRLRPGHASQAVSLRRFAFIESVAAIALAFTMTQIFIGNVSLLNKYLLVFSLVLSVVVKVFWKFVVLFWDNAGRWIGNWLTVRRISFTIDAMAPFILMAAIYMPDIEGVKAVIFSIDRFYHIDSIVMSPGWATLKGFVVNVDTQSIYGIGIPVVLSRLAQWLGGFSYENVIKVMMGMVILYSFGFYVLLRILSRDAVLSLSGLIVFISWQLFNVDSVILIWPSRTPVRFFFDIFLLIFLFLHSRHRGFLYLILASITVGVSLFYTHDSGIYQFIAMSGYVLYLLLSPNQSLAGGKKGKGKEWTGWFISLLLPPVILFFLAALVSGPHAFTIEFWKSIVVLLKDLSSTGALPYYENLTSGRHVKFFAASAIVLVYLVTLIYVGALDFLKKSAPKNAFAIFLAIYGLGLFQYHVWRAIDVNYLVVSVPFVLLLVFWSVEFKEKLKPSVRALFAALLLVISVLFLATNEKFRQCPNLLSGGRVNLETNKNFIKGVLDVREDASLIKRLTREDEHVCLISSFAEVILIEADRKPFFYNAPLVRSTFFFNHDETYGTANFFRGESDVEGVKINMQCLRDQKPQYVFIEKRIFFKIGNAKLFDKPGYFLYELTEYLKANYVPAAEQGVYLFVLRRR